MGERSRVNRLELERLRDLLGPLTLECCPDRASTFNHSLAVFREFVDAIVRAKELGMSVHTDLEDCTGMFEDLAAEREELRRSCCSGKPSRQRS